MKRNSSGIYNISENNKVARINEEDGIVTTDPHFPARELEAKGVRIF